MNKQDLYNADQKARAVAKSLTDEELASRLLMATESPRRFDKATNRALAYETAIRLRKYAQLPTGEVGR